MLVFQDDVMQKIYFHAQSEYPRECCGILLGRQLDGRRVADRMIPVRNMADERQSGVHFLINPLEIVKVELLAEREKREIVGFYHSHPDYDAAASKEDILHMIAGYSYPIISVKNGICVRLNSFEKLKQADHDAKEEIWIKEKEE